MKSLCASGVKNEVSYRCVSLGQQTGAEKDSRRGLFLREEQHQAEDHDGDERQEDIEKDSPQPRSAALAPVVQFGAFGNSHFLRMLEIELHFVRICVTILG